MKPENEFTCCITVMSDGKILDHFQVSTFVGQREWGVTSLVDWLCMWKTTINNVTAIDKYLLFGSTCLLMRALTISRLPCEHSRERGVSPASFTATVDTLYKQIVDTRKLTVCSTHTFWVTLMFLSEIFDSLQVSTHIGQREWSVTNLVYCTCTCTSVLK